MNRPKMVSKKVPLRVLRARATRDQLRVKKSQADQANQYQTGHTPIKLNVTQQPKGLRTFSLTPYEKRQLNESIEQFGYSVTKNVLRRQIPAVHAHHQHVLQPLLFERLQNQLALSPVLRQAIINDLIQRIEQSFKLFEKPRNLRKASQFLKSETMQSFFSSESIKILFSNWAHRWSEYQLASAQIAGVIHLNRPKLDRVERITQLSERKKKVVARLTEIKTSALEKARAEKEKIIKEFQAVIGQHFRTPKS